MKPPPRPFDKKDSWDQRFVPRGAFVRTDSRDGKGVPANQEERAGKRQETEAEARQRVNKRDTNRWQDPQGRFGLGAKK
jgi:hypothetical protein